MPQTSASYVITCSGAKLKYIPVSGDGVKPIRDKIAAWLETTITIPSDIKDFRYSSVDGFHFWFDGVQQKRIGLVLKTELRGAYDWWESDITFDTTVTEEQLVEAAKNKETEVTLGVWGFNWATPATEPKQTITIKLDVNNTYLYGLDGEDSDPLFDPEIAEDLATDKKPESDNPSGGGDSGQGSESENEKNPEPDKGQDTETSNNQNDDASNNSNVLDKTDESSDINKTPKAPNTGSNYDLDRTDVVAKDFILLSGIVFLVLLVLASVYKVLRK